MMRDLQVAAIELDEQWDYIGKKQKRVKQDDSDEMGDVWLFIALAANQKAILSYVVGKRIVKTRKRSPSICARGSSIVRKSRPTAIRHIRQRDCDCVRHGSRFRGSHKEVRWRFQSARRGAPLLAGPRGGRRTDCNKRQAKSRFDQHIVCRALQSSSRMQMRRFTRLTNGFSKKLENHRAAVALWICFYTCAVFTKRCAAHPQWRLE